jgi:hypothetical protein
MRRTGARCARGRQGRCKPGRGRVWRPQTGWNVEVQDGGRRRFELIPPVVVVVARRHRPGLLRCTVAVSQKPFPFPKPERIIQLETPFPKGQYG